MDCRPFLTDSSVWRSSCRFSATFALFRSLSYSLAPAGPGRREGLLLTAALRHLESALPPYRTPYLDLLNFSSSPHPRQLRPALAKGLRGRGGDGVAASRNTAGSHRRGVKRVALRTRGLASLGFLFQTLGLCVEDRGLLEAVGFLLPPLSSRN